MDRMRYLVETLNRASEAYYQEDIEIMPNIEYDRLYDELCELEKLEGVVLSNSPTVKVGFEILSELEKVRHDSPMLSLDKTKDIEKLVSFLRDQEGLLSWKLDGLTIVLKYSGGELKQAITRGNGEIGEDITHNAKTFKNVPLKISFEGGLALRGEAIISYSDFEKINETIVTAEKYKNPRNLTSGTVRQLNSAVAAARNVKFYAFSLVYADGRKFVLKSEEIEWIKSMGFDIAGYKKVNSGNVEDEVKEFAQRIKSNDFASDGLVLTYNNTTFSESLGATSKFPRDSIAFKWADELAETVLRNIIWNTSRTGLINPIAVFEPVELEGTTVSRASVHNVSVLEALELGIGDRVSVYKANMIIPQIAENFTRSGNVKIPGNCPVCDGGTEIISVKEGKALYCTNPNCQAQLVRFLAHYASRDAMNIEGFSIQTIEKFVEKGWLNNYTDIYSLYKFEDDIKNMEGFGEKSYAKIIESIEKSKNAELFSFIYALGINQVGLVSAKLLCKYYDYDIDKIKDAEEEDLINIEGFGLVISGFIYNYFHNEENVALLNKAMKILNIKKADTSAAGSGALEGLVFVVTGDVHRFKNRKELSGKIESLGGKVTASVTSKTSFLINNDVHSGSSKNKKAKELGVPIISEDEFIERFLPYSD